MNLKNEILGDYETFVMSKYLGNIIDLPTLYYDLMNYSENDRKYYLRLKVTNVLGDYTDDRKTILNALLGGLDWEALYQELKETIEIEWTQTQL
jgi:hypothetical protein